MLTPSGRTASTRSTVKPERLIQRLARQCRHQFQARKPCRAGGLHAGAHDLRGDALPCPVGMNEKRPDPRRLGGGVQQRVFLRLHLVAAIQRPPPTPAAARRPPCRRLRRRSMSRPRSTACPARTHTEWRSRSAPGCSRPGLTRGPRPGSSHARPANRRDGRGGQVAWEFSPRRRPSGEAFHGPGALLQIQPRERLFHRVTVGHIPPRLLAAQARHHVSHSLLPAYFPNPFKFAAVLAQRLEAQHFSSRSLVCEMIVCKFFQHIIRHA